MSALMKSLSLVKKLSAVNPALQAHIVRNLAGWNKDYKPGPYPKTEKEREAAAKKYYLLPEEYKPYADDGLGYGDYPKVGGGLGVEHKDNYYPYDYPEIKRNFNEPISVDHDLYSEDRYSQPDYPRYSKSYYMLCFAGVMGGCLALYYWLEDKKMYRPVAAKQYPADGVKHYTFER
ncbi:PREDICTED: NADH dehydrogenase [ubiquinone] 1 beta subcomplex subunit 8, mitochondrial [Drosophila arizonae]|uniref:NADH dehydrogenase [ubiquinone] 1 beta subcomplex subunit 8, mitochondrial n=1 Tax=Drosophila arizonae TaxID=7263 RepID=A0ABM1PXM9_DROAR|nr:PREDICTED: NADH dehydrogenase [ubiquinone] 1 beta subcomplex subunit 8, mitochondrial [Drosophila arizonae]